VRKSPGKSDIPINEKNPNTKKSDETPMEAPKIISNV